MSLFLASSVAALAMAMQDAQPVHYNVDIESQSGGPATVRVAVEFVGDTDGETRIALPNSWGGETELWNGLTALSVRGQDAMIVETEASDQLIIRHAPGAEITFAYDVIQDWEGIPTAGQGNDYRPVVQPEYVHLIGDTWVVDVEVGFDAPLTVSVNAPADWQLATDLTHAETFTPETLHASILVAGDFRVHERIIDGVSVRVAMRGQYAFSDVMFVDMLRSAMQANHEYWEGGAQPYLVTMLSLDSAPDWVSMGGTNLGDSFAFFATTDAETDFMVNLLGHEHNHSWVPGQLGGTYPGMEEPAGYWFSEGMTEFATFRAGVKGGLWDAAASVAQWNGALTELAQSPLVNAPNNVIRDAFWSDPNAQRLPYTRGVVFGALVDYQIREGTNGAQDLDNVLQHMLATGEEHEIAAEAFIGEVLEQTGVDVRDLYETHILAGVPMALPADTFGACGQVVGEERPVFELGLELANDELGRLVIVGVVEGSAAEAAGFQAGMIIGGLLEGAQGDGSRDMVLRVELDGAESEIRFRPTNGQTSLFQEIVVPEDVDWQACHAVLAGL